ncbi:MAG TPA: MATE family efflux transporter [Gemmatimonadaceae bacterium]|nr:MATE family efflux transporter [Gemmatimonadaceae bacterium]
MVLPTPSDLRAMLRLALPVAAVQLGIMAMGVTDTIMVGHLSPAALAAGALGNLYFFIAGIFGQGTLMALDPVISQAVGARDAEAISRALQRGLVVALALTVFTCATFVPVEWVLRVLDQPPEVIPDAASYVRIAIPGVFPFYAFVVFRQSLQAMHRVAPVLWTVLLANLLNAGLNWVFIYGHLGSPALGVAGSSIATSVSRWAMALAVLSISGRQVWHHLTPWRPETLAIEPLRRMLRLGLPIGVQYLLEYGAFAAAALLMGVLGTTQMAAHQIAINLASFTFMVPLGVSTATAVLVGHAIGAGDEDQARRSAVAGIFIGASFMCASAFVFLVFPGALARSYTGDADVIMLTVMLIPIAGVFQVFDGIQAVAAGVLRGVGDTHAPAVINVVGFWFIGLPVSWVLAFRLGGGAVGMWWGIVVGLAAVALILLGRVRVRLGRTMHRVIIDEAIG